MKATEALKQTVLRRTDEIDTDGYHQSIMNIMYEQWQKEDAMSYSDILNWFETNYGSLAKFAVLMAKLSKTAPLFTGVISTFMAPMILQKWIKK